jgi:hypothetical protein
MEQELIDAFSLLLSEMEPVVDSLPSEVRHAYSDACAKLADWEAGTTNV